MEISAEKIAEWVQGEIVGDPNKTVSSLSNIEEAKPNDLTFLANDKYISYLPTTEAGVVLMNKSFFTQPKDNTTFILVDDAYKSITELLKMYDSLKESKTGIDETAHFGDSVTFNDDIYVGAFAYIGENVTLGKGCKIHPHAFISDNVIIGENTIINAGVKIYDNCKIGNHCIIHAGTVIGSDGFGFNFNTEKNYYEKVPQVGNVVIEDYVEIGSNCTIDRATMGSTVIKKGVKLDNLIQIAHNVVIGENTVIAAQSGVAGSTKIGQFALIGGQVGITGHLKIGNQVQIQAQSGVNNNVADGTQLYGSPAMQAGDFRKSYVFFRKLPKLVERIEKIEESLKDKT